MDKKEKAAYKQGIIDFVSKMSADYRQHNARAVHEDILAAIIFFDIDPAAFYDEEIQQNIVKAEAEVYKLTGKVYGS